MINILIISKYILLSYYIAMASIIFDLQHYDEHMCNDMIAFAESAGFETCCTNNLLDVFCNSVEQIPQLKSWNTKNGIIELHKKSPRLQHVCSVSDKKNRSKMPSYANSFNMKQIANIYSIPPPSNKKSLVAVVSFGGGIYGNVSPTGVVTNGDFQTYWNALGIRKEDQPTVMLKLLQGAKNNPTVDDGGATMENTLDVETIGGACPTSNLTIVLYIAPNSATFASVFEYVYTTKINGMTPNVVSCSWGQSEIYVPKNDLTATNNILQKMTSNGINICVASGDYGSNNGVGGTGKYVDFPSSCPYVTSVGGTTLKCPNFIYDSSTIETSWSTSGGGFSSKFPKPSYQSNITASGRSTPDIASCGDPNTGVIYYVGGSYEVIGGTSIGAPTIAAYLLAIGANKFINPVLYTVKVNPLLYSSTTSCFHDIVSGTNGAYKANLGYDNCTGWGSINGAVLKTKISTSAPSVTSTPSVRKPIIRGPIILDNNIRPRLSTDVYNFKQLASIYNFPAPSDQPYVVAIPAFSDADKSNLLRGAVQDSTDSSLYTITDGDVQQSWASMGISPENYPLVLMKLMPGATIDPNEGDAEATLDVTTLGAACPSSNLTIIVYVQPNGGTTPYYETFNYIYTTPVVFNGVTYKTNLISSSLGNAEVDVDDADKNATNDLFKTMTEEGINILVASGDEGSYGIKPAVAPYTGLNTGFPDSSPYAVSVGGTTLNCPNLVYDDSTVETVWNNDPVNSATGGGESNFFSKPSYQDIPALSAYTRRCTPDIALDADPYTLSGIYLNGVLTVQGGTSMSAPLFAGFLACINCRQWVTPLLYTAPSSCFHDITEGTNGVNPDFYSAAVGFDLCTGWGTINGLYLANQLSDTIYCTGLAVSPNFLIVEKTKTAQLVATVTPENATNKTLSYTSSDTTIATVSNTGLVTGIKVGLANIEVRTTDGSNLLSIVPVTVISDPICVAKNTMITMVDGSTKPIQNVNRGDRLMCDKETGSFRRVCRLTEMVHHGNAILLPKGLLGNTRDIIITPDHPVWIGNQYRMYSKNIPGAVPIKMLNRVYNIQFEEEGSYYVEGIKVDSMSPNFYQMKLPRNLFFNPLKHNKRLFISEEDDPIRGKPPMSETKLKS